MGHKGTLGNTYERTRKDYGIHFSKTTSIKHPKKARSIDFAKYVFSNVLSGLYGLRVSGLGIFLI